MRHENHLNCSKMCKQLQVTASCKVVWKNNSRCSHLESANLLSLLSGLVFLSQLLFYVLAVHELGLEDSPKYTWDNGVWNLERTVHERAFVGGSAYLLLTFCTLLFKGPKLIVTGRPLQPRRIKYPVTPRCSKKGRRVGRAEKSLQKSMPLAILLRRELGKKQDNIKSQLQIALFWHPNWQETSQLITTLHFAPKK